MYKIMHFENSNFTFVIAFSSNYFRNLSKFCVIIVFLKLSKAKSLVKIKIWASLVGVVEGVVEVVTSMILRQSDWRRCVTASLD